MTFKRPNTIGYVNDSCKIYRHCSNMRPEELLSLSTVLKKNTIDTKRYSNDRLLYGNLITFFKVVYYSINYAD